MANKQEIFYIANLLSKFNAFLTPLLPQTTAGISSLGFILSLTKQILWKPGLRSGHPEIEVLKGIHKPKVEGRDHCPVEIASGQCHDPFSKRFTCLCVFS